MLKKMMRILILSFVILVSGFNLVEAGSNEAGENKDEASVDIGNNKEVNKIMEEERKRQKHRHEFKKQLESNYISEEDFLDKGYYYSGKNGEVIIQLKKSIEKTSLADQKINKIIRGLTGKFSNKNVIVEYVDYSYNDLETIFFEIIKELNKLKINSSEYILSLSEKENKIVLEVKDYDDKIKQLAKEYSSILRVQKNNDITLDSAEKSRRENWNSLGGGIAYQTVRNTGCTTSGVVYKGNTYYLMTAGHCMASYNTNLYEDNILGRQYSYYVGKEHLNAYDSGFDVGLIRLTTDSPIQRYATNGLLINENDSGYDAKINGNKTDFKVDDSVCKSGIATGLTCGRIQSTLRTFSYTDRPSITLTGARVVSNLPSSEYDLSARGDSGSPWFDVNLNLIGIHSGGSNEGNYANFTRWRDVASRYGLYLYTSNTRTLIQ